jgi:hypothetical protein
MKIDKHDKHEHDKQITRPICSIMTAAVYMQQVFFDREKKTNANFVFFLFLSRTTRGHDFSSGSTTSRGFAFHLRDFFPQCGPEQRGKFLQLGWRKFLRPRAGLSRSAGRSFPCRRTFFSRCRVSHFRMEPRWYFLSRYFFSRDGKYNKI